MDDSIKFENAVFQYRKQWIPFIDSLPYPKDDYERVHNQESAIKFLTKFVNPNESLKFNFFSLIALVPSVLCTAAITLVSRLRKKHREGLKRKVDCVVIVEGREYAASKKGLNLPKEVEVSFPQRVDYNVTTKTCFFNGRLNKQSVKILFQMIKRYPLSFYEILSVFAHISLIAKIQEEFKTEAIITFESENDFSSSLVSHYCEQTGMKYINVMHGDNWINPIHYNVRFSSFYVWDSFYVEQFVRTGSPREIFKIYSPDRFNLSINTNKRKTTDITYYLQGQDEEKLVRIRDILCNFTHAGMKCKIRMHPRASDPVTVRRVFSIGNIEIEDYKTIPLTASFEDTKYIVTCFSTVLSEAFENGLTAVIDDITDRETFIALDELDYINIHRIKNRLSGLCHKFNIAY